MRNAVIQLFSGNALSKGLGLAREVLTAALFGTGHAVGAFRIAQTGTLVPVNFFSSDALNSAFIPQYKYFAARSRDQAQTLFWSLLGVFFVVAVLIGVGLAWAAGVWVDVLAPGLDQNTVDIATMMLRIMAVGVPFYLVSAVVMFLAMANADFAPMSIRPVVQNVGLIGGVLLAFLLNNLAYMAYGFTVSYIAYTVWVFARTGHAGMLSLPHAWGWPGVTEVLRAFWLTLRPLLLLPVLLQGNIVVERAVASLIGLAAISSLDYARFITETLVLLISVPVAFAGLSYWSGLSAQAIQQRLQKAQLLMLIVAVPFSAFLSAHAEQVVELVYARGAFNQESVEVTADILFGIALGLWAQVIAYVLVKALNAQMRNRTALIVMAIALAGNALFNLAMHPYLGAMTLGLGSAVYGMVLLAGTLVVLDLWKSFIRHGLLMALGALGYVLLDYWMPAPEGLYGGTIAACALALVYWSLWILLIPLLRHSALDAIAPKWRKVN